MLFNSISISIDTWYLQGTKQMKHETYFGIKQDLTFHNPFMSAVLQLIMLVLVYEWGIKYMQTTTLVGSPPN